MSAQIASNLPKRQKAWTGKIQPGKTYDIDTALALVKEFAVAKFDESVDVAVNLGIDATKSDQQVRGSTVLPNGTGKSVRVAVFTGGKNQDVARAAGAFCLGMLQLAFADCVEQKGIRAAWLRAGLDVAFAGGATNREAGAGECGGQFPRS